jgi:hypothetical protein
MQDAAVILLDHTVAGVLAAAIDAQDPHCRECSRRPSGTELQTAPGIGRDTT